jgi:hypothetical protein
MLDLYVGFDLVIRSRAHQVEKIEIAVAERLRGREERRLGPIHCWDDKSNYEIGQVEGDSYV